MGHPGQDLSIVSPVGYSSSSCGYCSENGRRSSGKTSHKYGLWAHDLSPSHYQALCDAGWRRSGHYVYKPDLRRTCCSQVTIRLNADEFRASKRHRRVLRNAAEQLQGSETDTQDASAFRQVWGKGKGKGRYSESISFEEAFDSIQGRAETWAPPQGRQELAQEHERRRQAAMLARRGYRNSLPGPPFLAGAKLKRRLVTTLIPAQASKEKYALFKRYQIGIHKEGEDDVSLSSFKRFLCDSPVRREAPERQSENLDGNGEPLTYGLYHMEWRLIPNDGDQSESQGQLVAVGVLDLLPACVSSVYLFYDPKWASLQLGKLSALREVLLAQELKRAGLLQAPEAWYYMGYYIWNCPKMRYKGEYGPSELLDAADGSWWPLDVAERNLASGLGYAWTQGADRRSSSPRDEPCDDDDSDDERFLPTPSPPGCASPRSLDPRAVAMLRILEADRQKEGLKPYAVSLFA